MSHVVTIKTQVRDPAAVRRACQHMKLPPPVEGVHALYSGSIEGLAVQLPQWRYPVVCQLATGQLRYDNFEDRWGDPRYLAAFLQSYAVEKCRLEARRKGHSVSEQQLADGSIKLTIRVNGGAA